MRERFQIILPGLFDLPLDELGDAFVRDELTHLNRLLRFARPQSSRAHSIDAMLQAALGWAPGEPGNAPGLPLARAWAGAADEVGDRLLLFEAVHLRPDLHSAILVPIEKSAENLADIHFIINDLSSLFKVDCDISAVADGVFLLGLNGFAAPRHYPHILSVLGKAANPYMEQSREILPWHRLLNEMQMFMHQHEVNQRRLRQGRLALNSLWFWGGGGPAPELVSQPGWYCDDLLLNRFAQSLELRPRPLRELRGELPDCIITDLRLLQTLKATRTDVLPDLLRDIESNLLSPLLDAAMRQRGNLVLRAGFNLDFELTPGARYRFWRPARCLLDWNLPAAYERE